jgi:hypothetical protein
LVEPRRLHDRGAGKRRAPPARYRLVALVLGAALYLAGCGGAPPPGTEIPDPVSGRSWEPEEKFLRPPADHFVGVSRGFAEEADARNDAVLDARKQIVASLGTSLDTRIVETILTQQSTADILTPDIQSTAVAEAIAGSIVAVRPTDFHVQRWKTSSEGRVDYIYKAWALVPFSKAEHDGFIADLVAQTETLADRALSKGTGGESEGKFLDALLQYSDVRNSASKVLSMPGILPNLTTALREIVQDGDARAKSLAHGLRLTVENDGQSCRVGQGLPRPLVVRASFLREGTEAPAAGVPIVFSFVEGSGDIDALVTTDGNGRAEAKVHRVDSLDPRNQVEASVGLDDAGLGELPFPKVRFSLASRKATVRISFEVLCSGENLAESPLRNAVVSQLKAHGYEVMLGEGPEPADVAIAGAVRAGDPNQVAPGYVVCRAEANLNLVDLATGQTLAAATLPNDTYADTRGFANTGEKACRNALTLERIREIYGVDPAEYLVSELLKGIE